MVSDIRNMWSDYSTGRWRSGTAVPSPTLGVVEDGHEAEAARGGDRWVVYRRHGLFMSRTGTKRKRREAETDGLCTDGTDSLCRGRARSGSGERRKQMVCVPTALTLYSVTRQPCNHRQNNYNSHNLK